MKSIPLIDFSPFLNGSAEERREVAGQIGAACEEIGFFSIINHGIPEDASLVAYKIIKQFFDLPLEVKQRVKRPGPEESRGYNAIGTESLSYSLGEAAPHDLKETFAMGPVDRGDESYFTGPESYPHFAPNVWPAEPAELKAIWTDYYRSMRGLGLQLSRAFALALELPEEFFLDKLDRCTSLFRAQHYPQPSRDPMAGQLRAGAHTDYGTLTILRSENVQGGLQVRTRQGEWIDVHAAPGSFVVNIGDAMMMWTNDRWISTLHRVVNPPIEAVDGSRRMSLAFFQTPNYDALLECLPSCTSADNPPRHAPIRAGDHKRTKFARANKVKVAPVPQVA